MTAPNDKPSSPQELAERWKDRMPYPDSPTAEWDRYNLAYGYLAQADEIARLRAEVKRLCKAPEDTLSEYPGCVYCMEAGTPVKDGEVCPKCGDRLPTRTERRLQADLDAANAALRDILDPKGGQGDEWRVKHAAAIETARK